MSLWSPRTVRGWFVLIVLGALLISQLASLALLASQQTILRSALHEAEAFRRTAGIVSLAQNATAETRRTIEDTASGPSFVVRFADAPIVDSSRRNEGLSEAFAETVSTPADSVRVAWDNAIGTVRVRQFERKLDNQRTIIITATPRVVMTPEPHI